MRLQFDPEEVQDIVDPFVGDLLAMFKTMEEEALEIIEKNAHLSVAKIISKIEKLFTE